MQLVGKTHEVVVGEAMFEWQDTLNVRDVLRSQGDLESLDIAEEILYLAPTDDREDVGSLLHNVRNSDWLSAINTET